MTSVFTAEGESVPVSVVEVQPNTVTALRTAEQDGYTAVQLGAGTARRLTKPRQGQLKDLPQVANSREFRLDDISEYEVGQTLDVSLFEEGEIVDVSGVSQGQRLRRDRQAPPLPPRTGDPRLRLAPPARLDRRRHVSRAGSSRARRMAGRMGNDTVTVKKLTVVRTDAERNLLLIKGSLPGARNALVVVRKVGNSAKGKA